MGDVGDRGVRDDGDRERGRGVHRRCTTPPSTASPASNLISHLCSLEADAPPIGVGRAAGESGHEPGQRELLGRAVVSTLTRPLNAVRLVTPSAQLVTKTVGRARAGTAMAAPFSAPRTSFNGTITGHRAIALADMDLEDIRQIKNATGTTVNDVVLAVAGGALRGYLDDRGELPVELAAGDRAGVGARGRRSAPAAPTRSPRCSPSSAPTPRTRWSGCTTWPSATGTPRSTTRDQRRLAAGLGGVRGAADLRPGRADVRRAAAAPSGTRSCTTWSSPTSPARRCRSTSWAPRSDALYPLGPVFHGAGLNVTVMSNNGQLHVGIIACRESMPDVDDLVERFPAELAALKKAVARPRRSRA